jgi:transposase
MWEFPVQEVRMPRAYSTDLRQRVIAACAAGTQSRRVIARQFQISEGPLYDWLRRWRAYGSFGPAPHGGGTPSHLDRTVLRELVEAQNDATLWPSTPMPTNSAWDGATAFLGSAPR